MPLGAPVALAQQRRELRDATRLHDVLLVHRELGRVEGGHWRRETVQHRCRVLECGGAQAAGEACGDHVAGAACPGDGESTRSVDELPKEPQDPFPCFNRAVREHRDEALDAAHLGDAQPRLIHTRLAHQA